jgi:hypothetical protein
VAAWGELRRSPDTAQNPGTINGGDEFPESSTAVGTKLNAFTGDCADFFNEMQEPWYRLPQVSFGYHYTTVDRGTATTTVTTTLTSGPTTTTSTSTTVTTRAWVQEPINRVQDVKTYTVIGMAGGSTTFVSVWDPKPCHKLEAWELPHLKPKDVKLLRDKIFQKYGAISLCVSVFGILVICNLPDTDTFKNKAWCALQANIAAVTLDYDRDGFPDNNDIWDKMRTGPNGHYFFMRSSTILNSVQKEMVQYIGSTIEVRQEVAFVSTNMDFESRREMVEESIHTWQMANSAVYPAWFGAPNTGCADPHLLPNLSTQQALKPSIQQCPYGPDLSGCNWQSSVLTRCAFFAMCNWYTNGLCCSQTGTWGRATNIIGGHCGNPSCAVNEFYYNLLVYWLGMGNGYAYNVGEVLQGANSFPADRVQVETALRNRGGACKELLDIMSNSSNGQLRSQITFQYAPPALTRTTTVTTTTSTTSTSTTSTSTTSTTTTLTPTTTTSTTTTLKSGKAGMILGAMELQVVSPMTFVNDPEIQVALTRGMAKVASCDVEWITVNLTKVYKKWRRLNASIQLLDNVKNYMDLRAEYENLARRLGKTLVRMDYQIQVPPPYNAYLYSNLVSNDPLWNTTNQLRLELISSIGTPAGLVIDRRYTPSVNIVDETEVEPLPQVPVDYYSMTSSAKTITGRAVAAAPQHCPRAMVFLFSALVSGIWASHFYH